MTDTDPLAGGPLTGVLDEHQRSLLSVISMPVRSTANHEGPKRWPSWSWVVGQMEQIGYSEDELPGILRSLPSIRGLGAGDRGRYGLVWRSDNHTPDPMPTERLGLTIAGFNSRGDVGTADALVAALSRLAADERKKAKPSVDGPTYVNVALKPYLHGNDPVNSFPLPEDVVSEVFKREFELPLESWRFLQ